MPKGYNADGSKKVRPVNSGRKKKEGKKLHSKLAIDVIQILSKLDNPVFFIENAIREKAVRQSGKRQEDPVTNSTRQKNTQIDLMDMLEQINAEKVISV